MGNDVRRVLIDADVGIDDAIAILYLAARPDVQVVGVGTVHGNCPADDATRNALAVLEVAGRADCPVAAGAADPLQQPAKYAAHVHGVDGLGDVGILPTGTRGPSGETAAEQILRVSHEQPGEVDLLALAPLTNIGLAIRQDPDVLTRFRSVVIMGGGGLFPPPGTLRAPDMNTDCDPAAAELVYAAPRRQMVMVGSNVCSPTVLDEAAIDLIAAADTPQARFVTRLLPCYMQAYMRRYGRRVCPMYDALAAAVLVDPSYVLTAHDGPANVVHDGASSRAWVMAREDGGPLALDVTPTPPTRAVLTVDIDRFLDELLAALISPIDAAPAA